MVSPVESGITFRSDGFGEDEQWDHDWNQIAAVLDVRWWIEHGDLFLDYGNGYPLLVLEDVYVDGRYLTGRLYSNNIDQRTVTLEMSRLVKMKIFVESPGKNIRFLYISHLY